MGPHVPKSVREPPASLFVRLQWKLHNFGWTNHGPWRPWVQTRHANSCILHSKTCRLFQRSCSAQMARPNLTTWNLTTSTDINQHESFLQEVQLNNATVRTSNEKWHLIHVIYVELNLQNQVTTINVQKNSLRSEQNCVIVCVVTLRSSHQRRGFQAACSFGSLQQKAWGEVAISL